MAASERSIPARLPVTRAIASPVTPARSDVRMVHAVQRTAGNRAVAAALASRRAAARPSVQRNATSANLQAFGRRLHDVVERIRLAVGGRTAPAAALAMQAATVATLKADAVAVQLASTNRRAFDVIDRLDTLAGSNRNPPPDAEVQSVIDGFDRSQAAFTSAAAATYTPRIDDVGAQPGAGRIASPTPQRPEDTAVAAEQAAESQLLSAGTSLIDARIELTMQAIARAYERHHRQQHDARTLLVFCGGEFAFRRSDGPCTSEERDRVANAFRNASVMYPDMLIMPGTIVSGEHYPHPRGGPPVWVKVTNTAPVFWNGSLLHSVDKKADAGTTAGIAPVSGRSDVASAQKRGSGPSFTGLGALRVAIEICADHDVSRAKGEGGQADISIVSGWGQSVQPGKVAMAPGGSGMAVSADSSGSGSSRWTWQGGSAPAGSWTPDVLARGGGWGASQGIRDVGHAAQAYWPPVAVGPAAPAGAGAGVPQLGAPPPGPPIPLVVGPDGQPLAS